MTAYFSFTKGREKLKVCRKEKVSSQLHRVSERKKEASKMGKRKEEGKSSFIFFETLSSPKGRKK